MTHPEASVLIVSFNTRDRLRNCLDSLRSVKDSTPLEILVVDNASADQSADMVRCEFPEVRLIRSDRNLGFANANNLAAESANGRYLILLNSDAVLSKGVIERAVARMDQHPEVGMAGGRLSDEQGGLQPSARLFPTLLLEFFTLSGLADRFPRSRLLGAFNRTWANPEVAAEVDWVPGAFAIIRRDVLTDTGLFDPRYFLYYEEVDLCRRIRQQGFRILYWPDLRIMHIGGESSRTLKDQTLSSAGSQLTLWRMRSQALYYRKWHGWLGAFTVRGLEQLWHGLRSLRNRHRSPEKSLESARICRLWNQAWSDTQAGRVSPTQPW